jgi:uncharacterized protein
MDQLRNVIFLLLLLGAFVSQGSTTDEIAAAGAVDFQWGVGIPLSDGVHLNATVYRPHDQSAPRPCVFTLTPYTGETYHNRGIYFAAHGYPFLTVDARGRGNSEGMFRPFLQEAHDGYEIVEWLARQPYCNGKVAMWGGSYAGYDQWATAKKRPPHLATIVPVASSFMMVDFPGPTAMVPDAIQWLTLTSGHTAQFGIWGDDALWMAIFRRWHESGTPFRQLDQFAGNPSPIFQEWISHPDTDAYWDEYNPTAQDYGSLEIPILTITGMYDGDQLGALEHYRRYMESTSAAGRARHYLVIGPWDHAGTRTPKDTFGGLNFGPASLMDLPKLHLDWYSWTMEGGPKPAVLTKPVLYYVTGAERWREADTLEGITAERRPFYLDSTGGAARSVYAPGNLGPSSHNGAPDRYFYDPSAPTMAAIESAVTPDSLVDQQVQNSNQAQVVYQSAPFTAETEVSGFFALTAYIGIDQKDTDFVVSVYEATLDGRVILLSSDFKRARYRETARSATLVMTRDPLRYEFKSFTFTSRMIGKGSRLRLIVSAANSVFAETNYNAGGIVAEESVKDAHPVNVRLYHDHQHPSVLYVPLAGTNGPN